MKKKQSKSGPSVPETNRGRDRVSFMISSSIGMKQLQCQRSKSCKSEFKRFSVGDQNHAIPNPSASQSEIKP